MKVHLFACIASIFLISAAAGETAAQAPQDLLMQRKDLAPYSAGTWGIDFSDQDRKVKPGDSFFDYQNKAWLAKVQFGPNEKIQAYWRDLRLLAVRRVSALLEGFAADTTAPAGSIEAKGGAFYRSFMDEKTVEARGVSPLRPELEAIRAVTSRSKIASLMGQLAGPGTIRAPSVSVPTGWSFFRLDDINQDRGHPDDYAIYVGAGGLVLPGPEYYSDAQFATLRTAYVTYITNILTLIGWPDASVRAQQILELETQIAKISWSHEQMLDQAGTYNPITVTALSKFAPGFDWHAFMTGAQLPDARAVVIDARSAFPRIARIFAKTSLDVLKARQAFALADQRVDILDKPLLDAAIAFRGNALGNGVFMGAAPRSFRAEKEMEASLGDLLSASYIAKYSSPQVKITAQAMAENMRKALDKRLQSISWMNPASRAKAREKLANMRILIGYPDHFDDYAGLVIDDQDLYGNYLRSAAYQWRVLRNRQGKPFDRSVWSVLAEYPTFNYSVTSNTVEIPAALLVPPFFDMKADSAVNYGAAGSVIGAMMATPFFTEQGLTYDGEGQLNAWLSPEEANRFSAIRRRLADQYSQVEPLPGIHLKGELLADEALGDLAGLEISLDAYRDSQKDLPAVVRDGYNGDQRFFLGRAQMWRAKLTESFARSQIATGSNEPPYMRVNGLLPNMKAWYAAFAVQPEDKLYIAPDKRVSLW